MAATFRALYALQESSGKYHVEFRELSELELPTGDVRIRVAYSSLNYKDGLAVTGRGKIIRRFPMVCGIDLAGTVEESSSPEFRAGDRVLATGQGLSEMRWGGYAQVASLPADAVVALPDALDLRQAMALGTAGLTAMLALTALENHGVRPGPNEVVVSGAAGGVGSLAVMFLARANYKVAASTGRPQLHDWLRGLGAASVVDRAELAAENSPLSSERWAAGVDTVGGRTLASMISATASFGAVAATGMVTGAEIPLSVFPFILRGVSLLGVSSAWTPKPPRLAAWKRLAETVSVKQLEGISRIEPLSRIFELSEEILAGRIQGRVVLDVNA
jgi:acrylyl-CoA reductase (NADPH)